MNTKQIMRQLHELKQHVDQIDDWVRQTTNTIYEMEEAIIDQEYEWCQEKQKELTFFQNATIDIDQFRLNPPRPVKEIESNRRGIQHNAADGFYQSIFQDLINA